jgi:CheY-like chemotaxis protein
LAVATTHTIPSLWVRRPTTAGTPDPVRFHVGSAETRSVLAEMVALDNARAQTLLAAQHQQQQQLQQQLEQLRGFSAVAAVHVTPATIAPEPSSPTALHPPTAPLLQSLREVWVVDDVRSNRELLARLLRRRGVANVAVVEGGPETVAAWDRLSPPDRDRLQAVLCDRCMPELDGHGVVVALRLRGFRGAFIAVTGDALDADRAAFRAAGADAVVCKPVRIRELEAALANVGLTLPSSVSTMAPT